MGCWCQPSPALTTEASVHWAICWGAPELEWRTTMASTDMALIVSTVSRSDSPFLVDDCDTEKLTTSAESRRAARSNEVRVLVESSKKARTTVLPRSAGTFGIGRSRIRAKLSVSPKSCSRSVAGEVVGGDQVLHRSISPISTRSSVALTVSVRRVGRFLPT